MNYEGKYIKYKTKYLELQKNIDNSYNFNNIGIIKGGAKKKLKKINNHSPIINLKRMDKLNLSDIEPNYKETVSEPWFSLISMGLKSVEGRKNKGRFKEMKVDDVILWTNNDFAPREVLTRITGKAEYNTFREYLETEGLDKCLPGIKDIDIGLSVYYKYFTKEDEKEFGVIAIRLELV